jgi:hypothetical protein
MNRTQVVRLGQPGDALDIQFIKASDGQIVLEVWINDAIHPRRLLKEVAAGPSDRLSVHMRVGDHGVLGLDFSPSEPESDPGEGDAQT